MDYLEKFFGAAKDYVMLILASAVFVIAGVLENVLCMTHGVIW